MKLFTDKELLDFAKAHGFKAIYSSDKKGYVVVWDEDGKINTNSMSELQLWMGY